MAIHNYCSVSLLLRISLVMLFPLVLLATSVDVAAQQPSISVHDVVVSEGNSSTTQATFVVELSAPAPASPAVSFSYATSSTPDGTATAGTDYVAASGGPITFAAGQTQKQVVVDVKGDTVDEQQEFFYLDILNVQNATVTPSSSRGKGFIVDDDGPTISINDVSITEGNSGTKNATFTLTLSGPSVEAIAVRVETAAGTATASSDYNSINVVVLFQPGEVTHTVDVQIIGDSNLELNETFFVNITEAFATTIADGQGVGTILDDDTLLVLEQSGPTPQQAAAVESLLFTRDAFKVEGIALWFNLPPGQNTFVMIFAQNLRLNQGETASSIVVNLVDGNGQTFNVPATDVRPVQNADLTQVLFQLPENLASGTFNITIKAHGQMSNTGTIRITP